MLTDALLVLDRIFGHSSSAPKSDESQATVVQCVALCFGEIELGPGRSNEFN